MRVLLSTHGSCGDVELRVGPAERLAEVGVPLVPVGQSVRPLVHGVALPSAADLPRRAA